MRRDGDDRERKTFFEDSQNPRPVCVCVSAAAAATASLENIPATSRWMGWSPRAPPLSFFPR
jgi:hypothetical protein